MRETLPVSSFDTLLHAEMLEERVEFVSWGMQVCPTDPDTAECVTVPAVA